MFFGDFLWQKALSLPSAVCFLKGSDNVEEFPFTEIAQTINERMSSFLNESKTHSLDFPSTLGAGEIPGSVSPPDMPGTSPVALSVTLS